MRVMVTARVRLRGVRIRENRRNQCPYGLQSHSLMPRKVDAAVRSVVRPQFHLVLRVRGIVGLHEGLSLPAAIMRKVEGSGASAKAKNLHTAGRAKTPGDVCIHFEGGRRSVTSQRKKSEGEEHRQ